MAVTTSNLIQGPATLYIGDFGETEPADTAVASAPAVDWTDLGGTADGLTILISREFAELMVDQIVDIPERRIVKRDLQIKTNLAEATLENLAIALNGGTIATGGTGGTAYKSFSPAMDESSTQPTYRSIIVDGWAPAAKRRRVIVRKVLSIDSVETAYKKDGQMYWPVTLGAHYVSSSIKPFHVVDSTAV